MIYFLYSITYTMHDISYWGMVSALSSDPHVRNSLTSRTNLFAGIGGVIASILIPMLTTGSGTLGGSTATAYGRVALVICILAPLFLCATIFGVRERRESADPLDLACVPAAADRKRRRYGRSRLNVCVLRLRV